MRALRVQSTGIESGPSILRSRDIAPFLTNCDCSQCGDRARAILLGGMIGQSGYSIFASSSFGVSR
jgi:hypothetical protein